MFFYIYFFLNCASHSGTMSKSGKKTEKKLFTLMDIFMCVANLILILSCQKNDYDSFF